MSASELSRSLFKPLGEVVGSRHRCLILLAGEGREEQAAALFTEYANLRGEPTEILFAADSFEEDSSYARFKGWLEKFEGQVSVETLLYKNSEEILGLSFDGLVMDLAEQLRPNDLGRLVELVRGGGIIVLLTPKLEEWLRTVTRFRRRLLVPPYREEDLRDLFTRRLINTLKGKPGIWIFENGQLVEGKPYRSPPLESRMLSLPEDAEFPREIYRIALTQDQVEALKAFEEMLKPPKASVRRVLVLTANRGRGKSAVLGLGSAALLYRLGSKRKPFKIALTAPSFSNVRVVLDFAARGLKALGVNFEEVKVKGSTVALRCKLGIIDTVSPLNILRRKADLVLVDEAAGIPVPLLFKILRSFRKAVYSSTIHGYEGAGRGFGLRFMEALEKDKEVSLRRVELKTPIRYGEGDPVEAWLYDALLLNAEPAELTNQERLSLSPDHCIYISPNLEEWFLKQENMLRQFIGIYVLAHYRNRPDDVAILGEAPHHFARALITAEGKILASLHLCEEGSMPSEIIEEVTSGGNPPGNVIPSCIAKNYVPYRYFAKLRGLRVVRIAVHPELRGRGLGLKALDELSREAEALGYDWVGAGFGATPELLRFWLRAGFFPVYISPARNLVSGEYSVLVVKPLTGKALKLTRVLNLEFRLKLLDSLHDTYFGMETELAQLLLRGVNMDYGHPLQLTKVQKAALASYVSGTLTYEAASAAIRSLVKTHFLSSGKPRLKLSPKVETALLAKVFQGRPWKSSALRSGIPASNIKTVLRETVGEVFLHYGGEEASKLLERV
mgnify:CR=1 FL=1